MAGWRELGAAARASELTHSAWMMPLLCSEATPSATQRAAWSTALRLPLLLLLLLLLPWLRPWPGAGEGSRAATGGSGAAWCGGRVVSSCIQDGTRCASRAGCPGPAAATAVAAGGAAGGAGAAVGCLRLCLLQLPAALVLRMRPRSPSPPCRSTPLRLPIAQCSVTTCSSQPSAPTPV